MTVNFKHTIRLMILALILQVCVYGIVVARGFVASLVPSLPLASYTIFAGEQPSQRTVSVTETIGGGTYAVSESYQNAVKPSTVRAWRLTPAMRALDRTPAGYTPMYARWIGISGPAWSGCMALAPDSKTLRATPSMFAVPPLIGTWPVLVPHSPSLMWITADFLVSFAITAAACTARRHWKCRYGRCSNCSYPRINLPVSVRCTECGSAPEPGSSGSP